MVEKKSDPPTDRYVTPADWNRILPLRVAFAGASGTGKTTLVRMLSEQLEIPVCPVGARSVAESMGFSSPYDVDRAGERAAFQKKLFEEKRAWEEREPCFLTDRTHLDNLAYWVLAEGAGNVESVIPFAHACQRYTHVFHLPVENFQKLEGDPARKSEGFYHLLYDRFLVGLLSKFVPPFLSLRASALTLRFEHVARVLESPFRP